MTSAEQTVTTETHDGISFETPVGIDGKNPVTPNNPPAKAVTPDEPKQPKEKGIEDPKAPITPNNPANEKSQGFVSGDVNWLPDAAVTDNSPNTVKNPDAPSLEEAQSGDLKATDFQYAETAAGTTVTDDGVVKTLPIGENAPEPDPETGVVEGTPVSDHSSDSEPTANESEAERVAREQRETLEREEAERKGAAAGVVEEPKPTALKPEWVEFAKSKGATDEDLKDADGKDLTKDEIIAKYGTPSA